MTTERIKLAAIRTDGGTQMRAAIDPGVVEDYAEAYRAGAPMPAVTVFYDGKDYWLGNGFHRVEAQRACTFVDTEAEVRPGTRRDAVLHAAGANASNGLRPTNADKRRAVETLLRDEEWRKWSDNKIARACGVSNHFVATVKLSLGTAPSDTPRRFTTKHGTEAVMNTSAIGKSPKRVDAASPLAIAMTGAPPVALMPASNLFAPPANDGDEDFDEAPVRVPVVGDAEPVIPRESLDRRWGSFEVTAKVAAIVGIAHRFRADLATAFADVDPRFETEVRTRVQDALLGVTDAVIERLPAKPGEARPRLVLVPSGGKA